MEKFGSFCDWVQDRKVSKLKDKECCYPYHLISNCIYQQKTRTINNCRVKHSIQSEYMIYLSSVDKLIIKNREKIKKKQLKKDSPSKNIYFTRQQKKVIKNYNIDENFSGEEKETKYTVILKNDKLSKNKKVLPVKNKPNDNVERHKRKIAGSEFLTERRKSRRLSNQSPINVIIDIEEDNLNSSYDLKLLGLIPNKCKIKTKKEIKNEIIENDMGYLLDEDYSCQITNGQNQKNVPVDDKLLDEYQIINNFNFEKNPSNNPVSIFNTDICLENNFPQTLNYNSTENSVTYESISNSVFDETCDVTNTFTISENKFSHTYNNKTEESLTLENSFITDEVSEQMYTHKYSHTYDFTNINHINPLSEFTQTNKCNITESVTISENFSDTESIKLKQTNIYDNTNMYDDKEFNYFKPVPPTSCSYKPSTKQFLMSTVNKKEKLILPNEMEEGPSVIDEISLQNKYLEEAEIKKASIMLEKVLQNEITTNVPYKIKTCFKIKSKEVLSQNKKCLETIERKNLLFPFEDCPEINKSEKVSSLLENSYKVDKQPSPNKTFSKTNDTKEFLPTQETSSVIIVTEKISIPLKPNFKITETKEVPFPNKSDSQITESKDDLSLKETQSDITKMEKTTCLQETFSDINVAKKVLLPSKLTSITEIKNSLFLEEQHSESTESKKNINLKETFSELNKKEEESSLCKPYLKIIETEETSSLQETFSEINKTKKVPSPCKPYPKITETENALFLEEKHSEITEKASSLKSYSKVVETENTPYQSELFSNKFISRRPSILRTYSKRTLRGPHIPNKYSKETSEDRTQPEIYSEMIVKDKTLQLNPKSSIDITPENKPSNILPEINLIDKPSYPKQTVKNNQVPSKKYTEIIKINKPIEQKNHLKTTEVESKEDKLNFAKSLGSEQFEKLCQIEKEDENSLKSKSKFSGPKILTEDYAENALACNPSISTDQLNNSYVLESNQTTINQNPVAIPAFTSKKSLESSFHPHRKCFDKCRYCLRKFDLLDSITHLSQIKNIKEQHECLKIVVSRLVGPNSCLCHMCFCYIRKQSSIQNLKKIPSTCMINNCKQIVYSMYSIPFLNKMKDLLQRKGIIFKQWINKNLKFHICDVHHNQLLNIIQCHLCGNRTIHKFEVYQSEVHVFQMILDEDQVPVSVKSDSFICKSCRVYLLWETCKNTDKFNDQLQDYVHHRDTVLRRIFEFNKSSYPSYLMDEKMKEKKIESKLQNNEKHSLSISSLPLTENNNNNHTITLAVNQKQMTCNSGKDEVVQNLKTYDVNKATILNSILADTSKLVFNEPSTTTVYLETNQRTPVQLNLNTSNIIPSQTPFTEPRSVQTKQKNEDFILPDINDEMLRLMYHKFFPNAQNLIKHLIFIEKSRLNGSLRLVDETVHQHHITHNNDHTTLLHQKSSSTIPSYLTQRRLKPESNKYNFNFNINNGKLKTAKQMKLIDCPKTMKNGLQYNEPHHILATATKPKIISPSLSSVSKNYIRKTLNNYSNKFIDRSSVKQVIGSSTITVTNTSANTSTDVPKLISISTISTNINSIVVKKPTITIATNNSLRATLTVSSTTAATTTIPVSQKLMKISRENGIKMKPMNFHNNSKMIFMNKNGIINANISQKKSKFVKISPKMRPSMPSNMLSWTPIINMQRTLKYIDPKKLIKKK